MSFEKLNLIKPLNKALTNEGYTTPTPIQEQAIPIILKGKDLLGCAQTGTGKTAAFALPILELLYNSNRGKKGQKIRSLIITPTRELAIQIGESLSTYGKFTGLKNAVIFGGVSRNSQIKKIKAGVDIIVATPGRLLDLIKQKYISLKDIEILVLDEADRMLDMGFIHDIRKILSKLSQKKQSLFFSATMPPEILKLSKTILVDPVKVEVTPASSTVEKIEQSVYFVDKPDKKKLLLHLLQDTTIYSALIFTRTKYGANIIAKVLNKAKISSDAIHGNKSQNARQNALKNFKSKKLRVLVATDIAARGIDVDELSHVINFDIPNEPETYVHRIGRTGRAGQEGVAISFCDKAERAYLKDIKKLIAVDIPIVKEHPFVESEANVVQVKRPAKKHTVGKTKPKKVNERTDFVRPKSKTKKKSDTLHTKTKQWKNKPKKNCSRVKKPA